MNYYNAQQISNCADKNESNSASLLRRMLRVALVATPLLSGCSDDEEPALPLPRFSEVAAESGIEFRHFNGAAGAYHYPETHGSGAAFADFNGDGFPDLYVVNSAASHGVLTAHLPANALFVNQTDGTFVDRAAEAGVADTSFGIGVGVGDIDNDGHADLYVTNWGANRLYRNLGNGRFADVTEQSGTGDLRVSTSTAFADIDLDSDLDLYVANDVRIVGDDLPECYRGLIQIYCGPGAYPGDSGSLFRNDGDFRFTDITESMGVWTEEGRQLGVGFADYDDDGDPDLYVANDHEPNFLFRNDGSRFAEVGVSSGVATSPDGAPEAGMGTDWSDYDRDGRLDLGVCNFQWEPCRLLHNAGAGQFADHTAQSGLGGPTYQTLTFGTDFIDVNNDGYPDLFLANGHVEPNIEILDSAGPRYAQHDQLFLNNRDGTFTDVSAASGLTTFSAGVGRGSAAADYDNDGDVDLFVSNNNQRPHLLRNDGGNRANWISVEVEGTRSNRSGIGTRVTVFSAGLRQMAEVRGGSSYLSHNDLRLHFGLGRRTEVDRILIRWPSGGSQTVGPVPARRFVRIVEGEPWTPL